MRAKKLFFIFAVFAGGTGLFCGCSNTRLAREVPATDYRVLARYEAETTHEDERVSGLGESSTWLHFVPSAQETSNGYFSDVGALFSGLSPTQALALRAAIADACKTSGADFLLLPRYDMDTTTAWFFYESAVCTVTGLPVKIKKVRQVPLTSSAREIKDVSGAPIRIRNDD